MARLHAPVAALIVASVLLAADARPSADAQDTRKSLIARAQVWSPTDIPAVDFKASPAGPDAFPFLATVNCDHLDKKLSGMSPKFACMIGKDDEVKVKYGGTNGEVYAEVATTRLLSALGFGADRMYPVRVICKGCPVTLNGTLRTNTGEYVFDPATIERKMPGTEVPPEEGWSWKELDAIDTSAGGATGAQRDALKLLAVFLQHTDTKPQQQRLICLDEPKGEAAGLSCDRPYMMLNDVGLTWGRATTFNNNGTSGMNLTEWSEIPVWKDATKCVANLSKSFTGTLEHPVISEEGRLFLANLLSQVSDSQLRDLFTTARVTLRMRTPGDARSGFPTVDEWVNAFKNKRDQIVKQRCA